jgi:deoxyribodipyrimidine photolyase-related protein
MGRPLRLLPVRPEGQEEDTCPVTPGYWWFLDRNREWLSHNPRMRRPVQGLDRLRDLPGLVAQEHDRGSRAP